MTTRTLSFSEAKELKTLFGYDWREAAEKLLDGEQDFTVGDDSRVINADIIDEVMKEELLSDLYVLGGCTPWFISDITGLDQGAIERIQKAGEYEALGMMLESHIDEVQSEIARLDGYGHHFNGWNGREDEADFMGESFHIFRGRAHQ